MNNNQIKEVIVGLFTNPNNEGRITIKVTHDRFGMRNVAAIFVDGEAIKETVVDVTEEVNDAAEQYTEMTKPQW